MGMTQNNALRPMMVAAGGTGGHVYPAMVMAEFIRTKGHPVIFITDERGKRFLPHDTTWLAQCVVLPQWSIRQLPKICWLIHQAFSTWKPDTVWGFGGNTTVMPLTMARVYRITTAIHQSDRVVGRANELLSHFVHHKFSSFAMPSGKQTPWIPVGLPLRSDFLANKPHSHITKPLHILIVGGSQGAHFWGELWPQAVALLPSTLRQWIHVRHQCPIQDIPSVHTAYGHAGLAPSQWELSPFYNDMPQQLAWAHVVFARSGASTLAELALASRPGYLVPYPNSAKNHQWHNAIGHLSDHPGWMIDQASLTPQRLAAQLQEWIDDPEKLCHHKPYPVSWTAPQSACDNMYTIAWESQSR